MPEVIKLVAPIKLKRKKGIAEWRERKTFFGKAVKTMTSLKTTAVLGATLGALLHPAMAGKIAMGGLKGAGKFAKARPLTTFIGLPTAYGVLKSSPKTRAVVKKYLDPREAVKRGEYVAGMIEDPKKLKAVGQKEGWWSAFKEAGKKGGQYGLIGAGVLGAGVLGKKYLDKRKRKEAVRDVGIVKKSLPVVPSGLAHPYVPQAILPSPTIQPTGRPQATKTPTPIQNIIQIQLR